MWWLIVSASAAEPCYGWTEPNQVEGANLSVEYNGLIDADDATRFLGVAEAAWTRYSDWGFETPVGTPSITFKSDPLARAGFTDTTTCGDLEHARMFVYEEAVQNELGDEVTAHELFHAVQYAYQPMNGYLGNYVIWPWWAEGTATWATLRAGDFGAELGSADINRYLGLGHLMLHQDALAQADPGRVGHLYGTALLAVHLEDVAGIDAVPGTFEAVVGQAGSAAWFPDVITSMELDWTELWRTYLARIPTLDVPLDTSLLDRPPVRSRPSSLPASYDAADSSEPPLQGLGWTIHRFDADLGDEGRDLEIIFDGAPGPQWHAVVVRTAGPRLGSAVQEWTAISVDSAGDGTATIAFEGDEPVFLVVSPEVQGTEAWSYAWSAQLAEEEVPASGCTHGGRAPAVGGLLLGLLLLRRRQN